MKKKSDRTNERPPLKRMGKREGPASGGRPFKRTFNREEDRPAGRPAFKGSRSSDQAEGKGRPPFKRVFNRDEERPSARPPYKGPRSSDQAEGRARPPFKRVFNREEERPAGRAPYKGPRGDDRPAGQGRPPFKRSFNRADERPSRKEPFAPTPRPVKKAANRPLAGTPPTSKGPAELLKTLDRVLSRAGVGSRTEARSWIGTGRVRVNGLLVQTPDYWVNPKTDTVLLDDKPIDIVERRYILLNKPKGYLTTYKDPENRPTVYDLLKGVEQFVGTVGRLDLDTSGLLLLTNDTDLAEAITNPAYKLEKTYLVKAATLLSDEQLNNLRQGVELEDGRTRPAQLEVIRQSEKHTFLELTITEGKNRQVRRMLEAVGSKVLKLVRVRLGPLNLDGLPIGTWRELTEAEVARLASGRVRPNTKAIEQAED